MTHNTAARLITRSRKRYPISPILHHLHWLPVENASFIKICVMCYKCLNQMAPSYLSESLKVYVPARHLRSSADETTLIVPNRNLKSSGYRSLYYLGPRLWNSLKQKIRAASSIDNFKIMMKHHLFREINRV